MFLRCVLMDWDPVTACEPADLRTVSALVDQAIARKWTPMV